MRKPKPIRVQGCEWCADFDFYGTPFIDSSAHYRGLTLSQAKRLYSWLGKAIEWVEKTPKKG